MFNTLYIVLRHIKSVTRKRCIVMHTKRIQFIIALLSETDHRSPGF